jgi:hypothetical protein
MWPFIGLLVLYVMSGIDRPLGTGTWLIVGFFVAVCVLFYPLMIVVGTTVNYFSYKYMREPFTYLFDDSGIHVSSALCDYTHRWCAISRVKKSGGFLMFFFLPGGAHCIPIRVIESAGVFGPLVALAKEHGVNVDGVQATPLRSTA